MRDSILIRLVSITRADQRFQDKNRVRFRRASVTSVTRVFAAYYLQEGTSRDKHQFVFLLLPKTHKECRFDKLISSILLYTPFISKDPGSS